MLHTCVIESFISKYDVREKAPIVPGGGVPLGFSSTRGVVISSFVVGSIKQAKRAESMQHEARGRAHNVPEEMGMDADHTFFNPDYVCHGTTRNSDGKILKEEFTHHGRVIKPTHRLWSKRFDG